MRSAAPHGIAFTDCGIESFQEFLADVRSHIGGVRQFPPGSHCEPDVIGRIMGEETNR